MENHQNRTFRYERKFFLDNTDRPFVEGLIKLHPSLISEIYHERYVNNIYFDYPDFRNFSDNANGNMYRKKYRIRLLIRGPKSLRLQNSLATFISNYKFPNGIKLSVDVDPISFN